MDLLGDRICWAVCSFLDTEETISIHPSLSWWGREVPTRINDEMNYFPKQRQRISLHIDLSLRFLSRKSVLFVFAADNSYSSSFTFSLDRLPRCASHATKVHELWTILNALMSTVPISFLGDVIARDRVWSSSYFYTTDLKNDSVT